MIQKKAKYTPKMEVILQKIISEKRTQMIDYIICISRCMGYNIDVVFFAVNYFDRYIENTPKLNMADLKTIAITCLFLAYKMDCDDEEEHLNNLIMSSDYQISFDDYCLTLQGAFNEVT